MKTELFVWQVLNGGYDAESLDNVAHVKFNMKRHKSDRFNGNMESNKEVRISFQFMSYY